MRQGIWLTLLIVLVVLVGVGGALILSFKPDGGLYYEKEWVQALLQVGLIAVLGIVASVVLERFKDTLEQRRDVSKLRFNILDESTRRYMEVKLVRRKIQNTKSFTNAETDLLNQCQTVFEIHMRNSVQLFRKGSNLAAYFKTMEHYLNEAANNPTSQERAGFDSSGFDTFSDAYEKAATIMRAEVTGMK